MPVKDNLLLILTKIHWVIRNQGLIELARRSCRYLKKHHLKGLLFYYIGRNFNYKMWLNRETKKVKVLLTHHQEKLAELSYNPLISIIIPTKDKAILLQKCINSIREKSSYKNYELVIIDNGSKDKAALEYFTQIIQIPNCKVIPFNKRFNYAEINNFAVGQAKGDYIVFLNNDIEVISSNWLEEMLGYAQQSRVGAVGTKLLFPNKTVQHGGVILGLHKVVGHAFYGLPAGDPGYMDLATVTRNCSAVTAACMMLRRSVFEEADGFDEKLDVAYNDVDFCLRIIQKGYYIVWTPHAVLYHHESATRGQYWPERNIKYFCEKWKDILEHGDPFYNINLALDRSDFMLKV